MWVRVSVGACVCVWWGLKMRKNPQKIRNGESSATRFRSTRSQVRQPAESRSNLRWHGQKTWPMRSPPDFDEFLPPRSRIRGYGVRSKTISISFYIIWHTFWLVRLYLFSSKPHFGGNMRSRRNNTLHNLRQLRITLKPWSQTIDEKLDITSY